MSEYQYVYFAAVDQPLDDEQLEFMENQSSRASISRWEFQNEYHYGNFRGDAHKMLHRGYDVHLHYANFGIRRLVFRLPFGLPLDAEFFDQCCEDSDAIFWIESTEGAGGLLEINPDGDAGSYSEDYYDFEGLIAALPRIRDMLLNGDPRPIYLAWLATSYGEEMIEPPVPAGLQQLPKELEELCEFFELSLDLLAAAAEGSPAEPAKQNHQKQIEKWIKQQSASGLRDLIKRILMEDNSLVRSEILKEVRQQGNLSPWPTVELKRSRAELFRLAETVEQRRRQREKEDREKARQLHLKSLAADPNATIKKARKLVEARSTANYREAATLLLDLQHALGEPHGSKRAQTAAKQLVRDHPTLHTLKSALRKNGLLE